MTGHVAVNMHLNRSIDPIADTVHMHMKQPDTFCLNVLALYIKETNYCHQTLIHITPSKATTTIKTYIKFHTPGISRQECITVWIATNKKQKHGRLKS